MTIEEIIGREYQRYVDFFVSSKEILEKDHPDLQCEVLISMNNEEPYPYRYIRPDLMSKSSDGNRLHLVHQDPDPDFETTCYDCGTFRLDIYPFTWSDMQLIFDKPPADMSQIDDWITRWMDVEDVGAAAHSGLSGTVHHFYQVEQHQEHKELWILMGDLGTAPPEALIELIELLGAQGMSHIVLAGTGS